MPQPNVGVIRVVVAIGAIACMLSLSYAQGPTLSAQATGSVGGSAQLVAVQLQPYLTSVPYAPDPSNPRRTSARPRGMTAEAIAAKELIDRGESQPGAILGPIVRPRLLGDAGPVLPAGEVRPSAPALGTFFQGATDNGSFPPDPSMAAGPNNVVIAVNGTVNIYNKTGVLLSSQPDGGACPPPAGATAPFFCTTDSPFDPWVVYDPYISRFWLLEVSCNDNAATANLGCDGTPSRSNFHLAVSNTSDATGGWSVFPPIDARIGSLTNWCDYPKLGFDIQAIYLTCNEFTFAADASQYSAIRVMTKSQFLNNTCCGWWDFWDLNEGNNSKSFALQPARMYGATLADGMFLVDAHGAAAGDSGLEVWHVTHAERCCGPGASSPDLTQKGVGVNGYGVPPAARQPGSNAACTTGTVCIDTGDARLLYAVWQGGLLATGHTVSCGADACANFTELNVGAYPDVSVVNDWTLSAPGVPYYYPAVDVNAAGNKTMVYSRSSATENPTAYFIGIPSSATCTNCQNGPETRLGPAGAATYQRCGAGGCAGLATNNRWGDYLGVARDPDGLGIWVHGEAAGAANTWVTQVGLTYQQPPPTNDNFAQALAVGIPVQVTINTSLATTEPTEPVSCRFNNDTRKTLWYRVTPGVSGSLDVNSAGSDFDTLVAAYTGSTLNALTRLACNDDFGPSRQARMTFPVSAGTTYFIQAGGNNSGGAAAGANLALNIRVTPAAPANDNFAQASLAALPASFTVDTTGATTEGGESLSCGPNPFSHTVWYRFTPAATTDVIVDTRNSDFDTVLVVYSGNSLGSLSSVTCNDNFGSGQQSDLFFTAQAGITYYIQAGGIAGAVGGRDQSFGTLRINLGAFPPANDNLVNIVSGPTTLPATLTVGTTFATTQAGEPLNCSGRTFDHTVWYRFTPSTNQQIQIDTLASDFDTVLSVYTGSAVNALSPVICNDNFGGVQSRVLFAATGGTTYQVQVGGGNGASGNLAIRFSTGLASNDNFSQATEVVGTFGWFSDVTTSATTEPGEPLTCGAVGFGKTVWYKLTPEASSSMEIHTLLSVTAGNQFLDTVLAVYKGADLATLTAVVCSDDTPPNNLGSRVLLTLDANTTYYVQVGAKGGASGTVVINFNLSTGNNDQATQATPVGDLPAVFAEVGGGWYRFTPVATIPLTVSATRTTSPETAGIVRVFTGAPNSLTLLTTSDDAVLLGGRAGQVVFTALAGTTYYVQAIFSGAGLISFRRGGKFTIELASTTSWQWFTTEPLPGQEVGNGFTLSVCLDAPQPQPCPNGGQPWGTPGGGWNADLSTLPLGARWIWRNGVTRFSFPADLQQIYISRTFPIVGPVTSAVLGIAADDLAEVRVNGVSVGTVGSITNRAQALAAQNGLQSFDIAPFLITGTNRLTIRAQNGPSSFGPCAGGCNYQLNPAGVVFGATIRLDLSGFSDSFLTASFSVIRAVHITELRTRIDALRMKYGLPVFGWTDNSLAAGMAISAVHLTELRAALLQAFDAAGPTAPPLPPFTDSVIVRGNTFIRAVHIKELRDAVVVLEDF